MKERQIDRKKKKNSAGGMKGEKKPSRPSRKERAGNLISDKDETKEGRAGGGERECNLRFYPSTLALEW